MQRDFTSRKNAILVVLALLLAADLALAIYSWQLSSFRQTSPKDFETQNLRLKVLRGDIKSAQDIKDNMPATRKDCEKFEQSLPPESTGYSSMTADLRQIEKKSGLQIVTLANKQKELPDRGIAEVSVEATVSGDYASVARFVNGLQRSDTFYIVDGLALSAEAQNQNANGLLRVALHLRTYFREGA